MTVAVQTPFASYTSSGSVTFAYSFKVNSASDLIVKVNGVTQNSALYSVTGVGSSAGSVVFISAPSVGAIVTIQRKALLQRTTDYQINGDLLASTVNPDFDALWMALQDTQYLQNYALQISPADIVGVNTTLPTPVGGTVIGWDALGKNLVNFVLQAGTSLVNLAASAGSSLIGFIQSGTGAVARTVQDKARESVSVKDFGAIGDGVTDDTAAIQALINYVYNSGSTLQKGRVFFPTGTYLVSTLNIPYGVELVGNGKYSTFITSTTNATIISLGVASSAKASISHLTIKGNSTGSSQHGIGYSSAGNVLDCNFTEVEIQSCGGNGINIVMANITVGMFYCTFKQVKCFYNIGYGARFAGGLFNIDLFDRCDFSNNNMGGVFYNGVLGMQNQKFLNCGFEGNGVGTASAFGVYADLALCHLDFDTCFFEGNGIGNAAFDSYGIRVVNPAYLGIRGTTIAQHKYGVSVLTMLYDYCGVFITGSYIFSNSVTPASVAGVYLDNCKMGLVDIKGTFLDNTLGLIYANDTTTPVLNNRAVMSLGLSNSRNAVTNGTFDTGVTGWNTLSSTIASVAGGVSGNCCEITTTAASQGISQTVPLTIGKLYKMSYWVKAGTAGSAASDIVMFDAGGQYAAMFMTSSSVWQQAEQIIRATSASNSFRITKGSAAVGTIFIDNVSVVEVAETQLGDVAYSPASSGGLVRCFTENFSDITASASITIPLNIPAKVRILGAQIRVNTALTAGETWTATFSGGSTEVLGTGQAVAKNTKLNWTSSAVTTAATNITITKTAGGAFTALGQINAVVYYEDFVPMASQP